MFRATICPSSGALLNCSRSVRFPYKSRGGCVSSRGWKHSLEALVICLIEHSRKLEALLQAASVIYTCLQLLRNFKKYWFFRRKKFLIMSTLLSIMVVILRRKRTGQSAIILTPQEVFLTS
jgi:hypothetical protein